MRLRRHRRQARAGHAAATGIGATIAARFAEAGAARATSATSSRARSPPTWRRTRRSAARQADVAEQDDVERLWPRARARLGGLDVLVNNAGVAGPAAPVEEMDVEGWRRTLDVNLTGAFLCVRAAVPHLKAAGGGSIVDHVVERRDHGSAVPGPVRGHEVGAHRAREDAGHGAGTPRHPRQRHLPRRRGRRAHPARHRRRGAEPRPERGRGVRRARGGRLAAHHGHRRRRGRARSCSWLGRRGEDLRPGAPRGRQRRARLTPVSRAAGAGPDAAGGRAAGAPRDAGRQCAGSAPVAQLRLDAAHDAVEPATISSIWCCVSVAGGSMRKVLALNSVPPVSTPSPKRPVATA